MSKEPWDEYPEVWPTKAAFFNWMRGAFRQALWSRYPGKIIFKNKNCEPPPIHIKTKAKSGAYCALSGEWAGKSALEVDHILGNVSLRDWSDVEPFVRHLCTTNDNMQLVTKAAHKIKSYAERQGLDFVQAGIEKEVIQFKKCTTEEQKEFLMSIGYGKDKNDPVLRNAKSRSDAFREYLKKGSV